MAGVYFYVYQLCRTAPHPAIKRAGPASTASGVWVGGTKTWQLCQKPRPCPDVCVWGGGHDSGGPSWASQGTGSLLACSCQANQFLVPKPAWWLWGQQITGATVVAPALGKPLRPTPGRPHPQKTRPGQPVHSRTVVTPHTRPPDPGPSCS